MHITTGTPTPAEPAAPQQHRGRSRMSTVLRTAVLGGLAVIGLSALADAASAAPGVKAGVRKNVLTVTGTSSADILRLRLQPGDPNRLQVDVRGDGTADFTFDRRQFTTITVLGNGGDDTLATDHVNGAFADTEATTLDGGAGNDTLLGSFGDERLLGGLGNDFADGQQGLDTISLGDGDDTFQWDPGDGSDVTVTGGTGNDTMAFNGSNIGEIFDISTNAGLVRFTRNIASIVLDLDDIEAINLNTFGGNDVIDINDTTGTDLTTITPNLSLFGGADDAIVDIVEVPVGVTIGRDGTTPVVDGLGAQVRVTGQWPLDQIHVTGTTTNDTVTIAGTPDADVIAAIANGTDAAIDGATPGILINLTGIETTDVELGAGDDRFSAVGNLAALTSFHVDGGADHDTLLGSNGNDTLDGGTGNDFADGQQGLDTISLGDGDDTFQWDPGDGSDVTVTGGTGNDTMAFNGSNIGEIFDISTNAGLVRFTRNIASIVLDLDDIEAINLNTFGGNDVIDINDTTGTDLTTITPNLSLFGGADDAIVDIVEVPVGVTIGRDGTTPVVDGLGAQVRVTGQWPLDQIHVTGTTTNDTVTIAGTPDADVIAAIANGTDAAIDGATPGILINLTGIETTDVELGAGDDRFSAVGNLAALTSFHVDGGADHDTLLGSNGNDTLDGGTGNDFADGQQGLDTISLGDGDDTFQWDPGDGSDVTVTGGTGNDTMAFNGSNIGEIFDISTNAGLVRFTRNIASIVLDLDDIEAINLNTFGGNDVIDINDTTGTDLTTITPNLSLFGGADDAIVDIVEVPVGVTIGRDGTTPVVDGLGAQVRVTGQWPLDQIHVTGTTTNDTVTIAGTPDADVIAAIANGTDAAIDGATPGILINLTGIETTDVELGAGDDRFSAVGNLAALTSFHVDGGADHDTLLGSNGNDTLDGGTGNDFADGQQGLDTISLGDGDDTFQWDPGDGSDVTVTGGTGNDTMAFNGSNIGEIFDISTNAGLVRFTRNIASIVLDLDDIEAINLNTFGGNDVIDINDTTGTDLTVVSANLAASGGATPDAVADDVVVNGTGGDDTFTVAADGTSIVSSGPGPEVRISGADPTLDELTVNGLDGTDTITPVPGVEALILLTLVP